jgi:hypothetical protein
MKMRALKAAVVGSAVALVLVGAAYVRNHLKTDQQRWSELPHLNKFAILSRRCHLQPLESHYMKRYDTTENALLGSGYLVRITVPVRDSRSQNRQIIGTITNMDWPHKASHWKLDYQKEEIQVTCRKEDVALWRASLREFETP